MSEAERNGVLLRALRDGGHEGVPLWQAACRGGRSWVMVVTANGYAQIVRPRPEEAGSGTQTPPAMNERPGRAGRGSARNEDRRLRGGGVGRDGVRGP